VLSRKVKKIALKEGDVHSCIAIEVNAQKFHDKEISDVREIKRKIVGMKEKKEKKDCSEREGRTRREKR